MSRHSLYMVAMRPLLRLLPAGASSPGGASLFAVKAQLTAVGIDGTPTILTAVVVMGQRAKSPQQETLQPRHTGDTHQPQRHPSNPNHMRTAHRPVETCIVIVVQRLSLPSDRQVPHRKC